MSYSRTSEPVRLERNVKAVAVPSGESVDLPAGGIGYITQALGGNFTIYLEGNLFRIANEDADAIGKEPTPPPALAESASDGDVEKLIWEQLHQVFDPEIPVNIVDLGLVYKVDVSAFEEGGRKVAVDMTLTAPGCGMGETLVADVESLLLRIPTVKAADVELVFDPPWSREMMSEAAKLETNTF
jgi:probable FeS assembly SUF system protein SufT